jgi:hypothetical protein
VGNLHCLSPKRITRYRTAEEKSRLAYEQRGVNLGEARRFLNREIGSESVRGALAHGAIAGNLTAAAGMPFLDLHQPSIR